MKHRLTKTEPTSFCRSTASIVRVAYPDSMAFDPRDLPRNIGAGTFREVSRHD